MADLRGVSSHSYRPRMEGAKFSLFRNSWIFACDLYVPGRQLPAKGAAQLRLRLTLSSLWLHQVSDSEPSCRLWQRRSAHLFLHRTAVLRSSAARSTLRPLK